jgi:hypothetical protein
MKLFIKKIIVFCVAIGVLLAGFVALYNYQFLSHEKVEVKTVILGDSHTQNGVNDKLLNWSKNYSNSGESYFYSFIKLRHLINENKFLDKVVLSYGQHNLSKITQEKWLLNDDNIKEKFGGLFPLFTLQDIGALFEMKSPKISIVLIKSVVNSSIYSIERQLLGKGLPFTGGFTPNDKVFNPNLKPQNMNMKGGRELAEYELEYLGKISDLCKKHSIQLFLLNTPVIESKTQKINFKDHVPKGVLYLDYHKI